MCICRLKYQYRIPSSANPMDDWIQQSLERHKLTVRDIVEGRPFFTLSLDLHFLGMSENDISGKRTNHV